MSDQHGSNTSLKSYVSRIEQLEEEKKSYTEDIREVYKEAASNGFDKKALRRVVRERAKDQEKRKAEDEQYALYAAEFGL